MTERTTPRPPAGLRLDAAERRAWAVLVPKLGAIGCFLPIDAPMLVALIESWQLHVRAVRALATARPAARKGLAEIRDTARLEARALAAEFLVIPARRVQLGAVDARGEDCELRRLFTPGVRIPRVRLSPAQARRLAAWNARAERGDAS